MKPPTTIEKVIVIGTIFIIGLIIGALTFATLEYKRGQIHALTGNIKYELITLSDSTKVWKWIDVN